MRFDIASAGGARRRAGTTPRVPRGMESGLAVAAALVGRGAGGGGLRRAVRERENCANPARFRYARSASRASCATWPRRICNPSCGYLGQNFSTPIWMPCTRRWRPIPGRGQSRCDAAGPTPSKSNYASASPSGIGASGKWWT